MDKDQCKGLNSPNCDANSNSSNISNGDTPQCDTDSNIIEEKESLNTEVNKDGTKETNL